MTEPRRDKQATEHQATNVTKPPRDHVLWPDFRKWAEQQFPKADLHNVMLAVYWDCFLAGAKAGREYGVKHGGD